jgi:hypothetical protein
MFVWHLDNVRIFRNATIDLEKDATITGTALLVTSVGVEAIEWKAVAIPTGYRVMVRSQTGRQSMYEGPTFNLILEVAAAIRRH